MKKIVFLFCILLSANLSAKLMMGEWQMHCAYNDVQQIEQSADKVYAVSDGSLFSVDKRDETIEYYTKLSGLNSTNITCIKYDKDTKTLLIIYENGNIDLLKDGGVENISDLYNKIMNASKAVNDAVFYDHNAYLATDFGVLVLNINKHEIANTCYIGENASEVQVKYITFVGDIVYAATSSAIYYANVKNDNIVDFSYWKTIPTLPTAGTITNIASFNDKLYVLMSNKLLYAFNGNSWTSIFPTMPLTSISTSCNHFFASTPTGCYNIHADYSLDTISVFYNAAEIEMDETTHTYWFAARTDGIGMYKHPTINKYLPDGPIVNIPYNLRFAGEKLFVVPGGRWSDRYNRAPYIMIYENGEWTNINATKTQMPDGVYPTDFINVAIDPKDDDHFFVTSYGMGVLEYQGTEFIQQYSYNNSLLYPAAPNNAKSYTRACGAIFDDEGNLWVANGGSDYNCLVVMDPTMDINKQARFGFEVKTPGEIVINANNPNEKWLPACRGNIGIYVLDDNGTPFITSDDKELLRKSFHDQDHKEVAPEYIYCIAQDKKGDIWVGTYDGLFYISANTDFFQSDAVNRILIPRNDGSELYDYLLNGEQINAIAVDGANRKWIGTASSGIYLMSKDGVETIEHFTSDNSPLPSNNILSIAVNPVTGEVFMGTGGGLVSYQSDAIEGNEEFTDVYAYPNPIRADYTGLITITGLIDNTNVKITDVAGNLIYEATSNGGIATWDGKDAYGNRVNTGVYLVQGVSEDGQSHVLTRILILN